MDQDVDEPWLLEVYGHDGKATNVTMEPGTMGVELPCSVSSNSSPIHPHLNKGPFGFLSNLFLQVIWSCTKAIPSSTAGKTLFSGLS